MAKTPEGKLKDKIKKRIEAHYAGNMWSFWPVQMGIGKHGIPDGLFCIAGLFVGIEVKPPVAEGTPRVEATGLQKDTRRQIHAAGGMSFIVDSLELLEQVINQIDFVLLHRED